MVSSPDPEDLDDVESYISDVETLVTAADEFTDAVHKAVLEVMASARVTPCVVVDEEDARQWFQFLAALYVKVA
jgi:hypothetical protein